MNSAPVSVVIPCYCCATTLPRAVTSVIEQRLRPTELILVKDCSPDGGATRDAISQVAMQYSRQPGFSVKPIFLDKNVGPGGARNAGWNAATKQYVAFLDADDSWRRQKVAVQYAWMEAHPDYELTGHGSVYRPPGGPDGEAEVDVDRVISSEVRLVPMLFKNRVLTRTVMLRRSLVQRFPEEARYSEDYALWLRLLTEGRRLSILSADLAEEHRPAFSVGGQSSNLWAMEKAELGLFLGMTRDRKLSRSLALLAMGASLLKYGRRMAIRQLKR